jgi:hypothetical protein
MCSLRLVNPTKMLIPTFEEMKSVLTGGFVFDAKGETRPMFVPPAPLSLKLLVLHRQSELVGSLSRPV